jgi:hypothetical protein
MFSVKYFAQVSLSTEYKVLKHYLCIESGTPGYAPGNFMHYDTFSKWKGVFWFTRVARFMVQMGFSNTDINKNQNVSVMP